MTRAESAPALPWQPLIAAATLVGGFALIAASFVVLSISDGRGAWSLKQARQYQEASAELHSLSHEYAHTKKGDNTKAIREKLGKAQNEYDVLLNQLETARNHPKRIATLLRICGALSIVAGVLTLYWARSAERSDIR